MDELILVGTHHFDFKGPERLMKLLRHFNPDVVTTEYDRQREVRVLKVRSMFSRPGFDFDNYLKLAYKELVNNQTAINYLRDISDYEYFTPRHYTRENRKPLI